MEENLYSCAQFWLLYQTSLGYSVWKILNVLMASRQESGIISLLELKECPFFSIM